MKKLKEFGQWFKAKGWKSYSAPWLIAALIDFGTFFTDNGISSMINDPEISIFMLILGAVALIGFHVGLTWHMLDAFKKQWPLKDKI